MALPEDLRARLVLPAMAAPMYLVSGVELAIACCLAGVIGSLTRNHCRSDEEFEHQLAAVTQALARARDDEPGRRIGPLAANLSITTPEPSRAAAIAACARHHVDIVVTASGDPTAIARAVHDAGGRVFHDVTSIRFAEKAIAAGVDGIVAIGAGGGGHSGTISHLALVPQIRAMFDGTIVMAGAIASGAAIRAAEVLGADLAYLGTRFIATRESLAPAAYKDMLVSQSPGDLLYSPFANGVPAMWLTESMRRLGLDPDAPPMPARPRDTSHLPDGVKPWVTLWSAGQGISLIDDIPEVADLVRRLRRDYITAANLRSMAEAAAWDLGS